MSAYNTISYYYNVSVREYWINNWIKNQYSIMIFYISVICHYFNHVFFQKMIREELFNLFDVILNM